MFPNFEVSFDIAGIATLSATAMGLIYRLGYTPLAKWVKKVNDTSKQVEEMSKRVNEISVNIEFIVTQMKTNGGSTWKDQMNRIEGKLSMLEQRYSVIQLDSPVYETDAEGLFISVNRTFCRLTGRTEKECLGNGWINTITDEDRKRVFHEWNYAVENGVEFNAVFNMIHTDGHIVKAHSIANIMRNLSGTVSGYLGSLDIIQETINKSK